MLLCSHLIFFYEAAKEKSIGCHTPDAKYNKEQYLHFVKTINQNAKDANSRWYPCLSKDLSLFIGLVWLSTKFRIYCGQFKQRLVPQPVWF